MPDYQKMYYSLFNDVTDAIGKLQEAQQKTEEMYINGKETILMPLSKNGEDTRQSDSPMKPDKSPSRGDR